MKRAVLILILALLVIVPSASLVRSAEAAPAVLSLPEVDKAWDAAQAPAEARPVNDSVYAPNAAEPQAFAAQAEAIAAQAEEPAPVFASVQHSGAPLSAVSYATASTTLAAATAPAAVTPPSLAPVKYTKSLRFDGYNAYYTTFTYTPSVTGIYYFADLNRTHWDSNIYIYDTTGEEVDADWSLFTPFKFATVLQAGYRYTIYVESLDTKSLSFIISPPATLGSTAYTIKSNGTTYEWYQSFNITIPTSGIYSLHITCPASCRYEVIMMNGSYGDYFSYYYDRELYDFNYFAAGTYHLLMRFVNYSSKSHTYTLAFDFEGNTHMNNGVPVTTTLARADTLTTNAFCPDVTGSYRFTSSRSDALFSVFDLDTGSYVGFNYTQSAIISLTKDHDYMIFIYTNGGAGTLTYTLFYLSPVSTLSAINVSSGTLSPAFSSSTYSYTLPVDSVAASSVTITPQQTAPGGTIFIDGVAQSSKTFPVTAATDQTVQIRSMSPSGSNTSTYNVGLRAMAQSAAVTAASSPLSFDGHFLTANVEGETASLTVNLSVSAYASWKLYSDSACTAELTDRTMALTEGLNKAYVRVTSEDGRNRTVYPVLVCRASDAALPVILAYNSGYSEISDGAVLASNVLVKLFGKAELTFSVTRNGEAMGWPADSVFSADGAYAVTLTDGNGAAVSFGFIIDKTAPGLSAVGPDNAAVANGALVNKAVTLVIAEPNPNTSAARLDGTAIDWPSDNTFTADGVYAITVTDRAGNSSAWSFTIDRTGPGISAVCGSAISDGAYVRANVTVTLSDLHYKSKSATRNGGKYTWPRNGVFSSAGVYVITGTDTAGNVSTFTFTIDKTSPSITAKTTSRSTVRNNRSANRDVVVTVSETYLASKTVTKDGAAYEWPANSTFTEEGKYVVTAVDLSGNTATFTFTVDKMPVLTVTTLTTGTKMNHKGYTTEGVQISLTDAFLTSQSLKRAGRTITWPTDGIVTEEGVYTVSAKDKYGNSLSFTFTIDRSAPAVTLKTRAKKLLADGGATNESYLTVSITDLTGCTKTVTRDGAAYRYPSGGKFSSEGVYVLVVTDSAGNATSLTFTVDRSAPMISCQTASGTTVAKGKTVNQDVRITVTDRTAISKTLTHNGAAIPWPESGTVSADGVYIVTASDMFGKTAAAFTFTIDKTGPAITTQSGGSPVNHNGFSSGNVTVSVIGNASAPTVTRDGVNCAYPASGIFTLEGVYAVSAPDALGNRTTFVFTIDSTAPVLTVVLASDGETAVADSGTVIDAAGVTLTLEELNIDTISITKDGEDYSAYPLAGEGDELLLWDGAEPLTLTENGVYVITVTDKAGNTFTFTLTIATA